MKLLIAALITAFSASAFAQIHTETLANDGDQVVLSNINAPAARVFLSYTGVRFDHCGIAIHVPNSNVDPQALHNVLRISTDGAELGQVNNGVLVAPVANPARTTHGQAFKVETRSGEALSYVLGLDVNDNKIDVIAEILSCR